MNSEIRSKAREALNGNWKTIIIISILVSLLTSVIPQNIFKMILGEEALNLLATTTDLSLLTNTQIEIITANIDRAFFLLILLMVFFSPIQTCFRWVILDLVRKKRVEQNQLIDYVKPNFIKLIIYYILHTLFLFFWSLLLFIPGIIKSFSYALSPYLLKDNPEMTANEAITKSRELMDGQKLKLFFLTLSFLGWFLLVILISGLINEAILSMSIENFKLNIFLTAFFETCVVAAVYVYYETAVAVFYEKVLKGEEGDNGSNVSLDKQSSPSSKIII